MNSSATMIMTAVKDRAEAEILAEALLDARAAACVQELPIHSHYRWKGKTHSDPEILPLVKTVADRVDLAIDTIKANHSYEVPEVLVMPVVRGLDAYVQWMWDETRPDNSSDAGGAG